MARLGRGPVSTVRTAHEGFGAAGSPDWRRDLSAAGPSLAGMTAKLDEIVVDCADPPRLARFWAVVLGGEAVDRDPDWSYVDPPDGPLRVAFQQVPEGKQGKNRLHLDVEVDDIDAEHDRLAAEGATTVADLHTTAHGRFQVMLDPEGNEFCLVK